MIIDTHTHIYPDRVAAIVIKKMAAQGLKPYGNFEYQDLLATMDRCGISAAVVFNIAEKPSLVKTANDFLASVSERKKLICLGTLNPYYEDFEDEIDRLKEMGLSGVKFSSTYQDFFADEERMFGIYQKLCDNDMIAYFHVGKDPVALEAEAKTSPRRLARVLEMFPKLKMVAAHFGGLEMLEEAEKYLIGRELYLDTAWTPSVEMLNPERIARIIKKHGPEKIFFGTDYPFSDAQRQIDWILRLPISAEDKERILWRNASEFFGFNFSHQL